MIAGQVVLCVSTDGRKYTPVQTTLAPDNHPIHRLSQRVNQPYTVQTTPKGPSWGIPKIDGRKRSKIKYVQPGAGKNLLKKYRLADKMIGIGQHLQLEVPVQVFDEDQKRRYS
jgi:hypothetical protein